MTQERTIADIVTDGLNTVFDEIGKEYGDLPPDEFVEQVKRAATDWAKECYGV